MVSATSISKLLALIEAISIGQKTKDNIFITSHDLKQINLDKDKAKHALTVLENEAGYKCIEIVDLTEGKDTLACINILDNFETSKEAFNAYIFYVRYEEKGAELFPRQDRQELETRFDRNKSDVNWGLDGVIEPEEPLIKRVKDYNCSLRLVGNDVVLEFNDGAYGILKTLRTDQAPFFFLKYMVMHADQIIPKAVIQTEVEMCGRKSDMTELVRQCGISKNLKKHFFLGTTKDKVMFTPYAKLPTEFVSESHI
jgi:hypothetical protein